MLLKNEAGDVEEARPDIGTPFGSAGYYAINFNDFTAAMLFLFQLLIVNNWQTFMQALVDVTDEWAYIFCISWFILGVLVMFNLVVAQVLGVFLDEAGESKRRSKQRDALLAQQSELIAAISGDADNPLLLEQLLAVDQQMADLILVGERKQHDLRRQYLHQQEANVCAIM
eukprot:SAG31_NODE_10921_length_1083_cov_1.417683_1_plen_171_part_00